MNVCSVFLEMEVLHKLSFYFLHLFNRYLLRHLPSGRYKMTKAAMISMLKMITI